MVTWDVIGSTSSVSAINNVGRFAFPVYLADGTLVSSSTTSTGLWSGSLLNPIDEDLSGALHKNLAVYTGTTTTGSASSRPLGDFLGVSLGDSGNTNGGWVHTGGAISGFSERLYGISEVLTAVPEPSSLVMAATAIVGVAALGWSGCSGNGRRSPVARKTTTE